MKKIHLAFLCLSSCIFNVHAQYIFNSCGNRPVYGDSLTGVLIYYDSTGVTSGNSGANVTWNYTNLTLTTTGKISHYYYDPSTIKDTSSSSHSPLFNTANLADLATNGVYSFYQYSPDSVSYLGDYRDAVDYQIAIGNEKQMICPFGFGNSFHDYFSLKNMGMCSFNSYINRIFTYDAFGTLNLGTTSYSVVRLKMVEQTTDSSNCSPIPNVSNNEDTTFTWFDINTGLPVFSFEFYNDTGNHFKNKTIEAYSYSHYPATLNTSVSPIGELQSEFTVFPNPSNGTFQVSSTKYQVSGIDIYNVMGEKVFASTINHQPSTIDLDAPNGIYFLQLKTSEGTAVKKIVLNK
jgi:hypothetical protein